tara:strand:+ start:132 stop:473 length:342 start_codon:yes stop_codon:yes gene_type:complete
MFIQITPGMGRPDQISPTGHAIDEGRAAQPCQSGVAGACPVFVDRVQWICDICVCCMGMAGHSAGSRNSRPRVKAGIAALNGVGKMPHYNVNLFRTDGIEQTPSAILQARYAS